MAGRRLAWVGSWVAMALGATLMGWPATAVRLADGTVYFEHPPDLVDYSTTRQGAFAAGATYYFTIRLPANAGEPLQRVTFTQTNGERGPHRIRFRLDETVAFEGTRRDRGDRLTLDETTVDPESRTVTVVFDPPLPPGSTATVGLRPHRNPRSGGIYLFRVVAFPAGEQAHGQPLGYGRFHISDPERRFFFFH